MSNMVPKKVDDPLNVIKWVTPKFYCRFFLNVLLTNYYYGTTENILEYHFTNERVVNG